MSFLSDFKSSTKGVPIDELPDLVFYRPLSFILVKLCEPYAITPNQLSLLALVVGVASGVYFAMGTHLGFILGGLLCYLSNVFDCSDGMLARLKSCGTVTGRIVDGVVGHILMIAMYTGFGIGLVRAEHSGLIELPFHPLLLAGLAGFGHLVKAGLSDYYACLYATHVLGKDCIPQLELKFFSRKMKKLRKTKAWSFDRMMIGLYIAYTRIQLGPNPKPFVRYDPEEYKRHNHLQVMLWNLAGPSMHISILFISALFFRPMIFLTYAVIISNIWILVLLPIQAAVNRKMKALHPGIS